MPWLIFAELLKPRGSKGILALVRLDRIIRMVLGGHFWTWTSLKIARIQRSAPNKL